MKSRPEKDAAEEQFERYLREAGISGGENHEPDLGGGYAARRPDYRINRGKAAAIVEVKGFERSSVEDASVGAAGL